MHRRADRRRLRRRQTVQVRRPALDGLQKPPVHHVRHAHAGGVAIAFPRQAADVNASNLRLPGPRIDGAPHAPVHHLRVQARAGKILAQLVHHQHVQIHRDARHPALGQRQQFLLAALHVLDRDGLDARRLVVRVLQNRQPAQNPARSEYHPPHAANHRLQPHVVAVVVVALGPCELAQSNGHHLEQAALERAVEIGVPLHAPAQHHAARAPRRPVHHHPDTLRRHAHLGHRQRAAHRAAHRRFRNAVFPEHGRLAAGRRRAVAAHGRKQERLHALLFPEGRRRAGDDVDIRDAPAADSDRHRGARLQPRHHARLR